MPELDETTRTVVGFVTTIMSGGTSAAVNLVMSALISVFIFWKLKDILKKKRDANTKKRRLGAPRENRQENVSDEKAFLDSEKAIEKELSGEGGE